MRGDSAWVHVVNIPELIKVCYSKPLPLSGFSHRISAASAYLCLLVRLGPIAGSMQNLASNSPGRFPTAQRRQRLARKSFSTQIFPPFWQLSGSSDNVSGVDKCQNLSAVWTMHRFYPWSATILDLPGYTLTRVVPRKGWEEANGIFSYSLWPSHIRGIWAAHLR